jgi:hypothetical protein
MFYKTIPEVVSLLIICYTIFFLFCAILVSTAKNITGKQNTWIQNSLKSQ